MRDEASEGIQSCSKWANTTIVTAIRRGLDASPTCPDHFWRADGCVDSVWATVCVRATYGCFHKKAEQPRVTLRCGVVVRSRGHRWTLSAGREGKATLRVAGDGAPWPQRAGLLPECISDSLCAKQRWCIFRASGEGEGATSRGRTRTPVCTEGLLFSGFGKRTNIDMLNHNCSAWEGKHSRLGCKIVALLACGIVLEASQFPSLVPGTGRALGRVGFLIPPTTTTTTVSTAFTA